MTLFKERLKHIRKSNNMTQQELADLLGVSKSTISSYECGVSQPSFDRLIRLANIFNVSLDYFFINMQLERAEYVNSTRVAVVDKIPHGCDIAKELADVSADTPINILYYRSISSECSPDHSEYFIFKQADRLYTIHIQDNYSAGDTVLACIGKGNADIYFSAKDNSGLVLFDRNNTKQNKNVHIIGIVTEAYNETKNPTA